MSVMMSTCKHCDQLITRGPGDRYWRSIEASASGLSCAVRARGARSFLADDHEPATPALTASQLKAGVVIHEDHRPLMTLGAVIPFLASLAFIIMTCLEIAWHT